MPIDPNCPKRASIIECDSHCLVLGGPGSGKTTVALRKAMARIRHGLVEGQSVLFLSFSRSAVARVLDAAKLEVSRKDLSQLTVETFHAFFWRLLKTHSYLLGAPRRLSILLPHDEKALNGGIDRDDDEWPAWEQERNRLFLEEGRVAFDLFAPHAAALLSRCGHLAPMVAATHPLIIVDEAQDTGTYAWRCVQLLGSQAQIVCLADLEQQIFDFLPGVGPERVAEIRLALVPFEVDLGSDNGRSPDSEILTFANDLLTGRPRGSPYKGVQQIPYKPGKDLNWNRLLRRSIKWILDATVAEGRTRPETIAILTDTAGNALQISKALSGIGDANIGKEVPHKLHFDEAEALLVSRLVAYLLEPKHPDARDKDIATCMEMLAAAKRATGMGKKETQVLLKQSLELRAGKKSRAGIVQALRDVLVRLDTEGFTGNPAADWIFVKRALRETHHADLQRAVRQLDYVVAFKRGHRISAGLADEWLRNNAYTRARAVLDMALSQEQILDSIELLTGLHVMNVHKSKGKQFDAVILVRQARHIGAKQTVSSFVWRDDQEPYTKSRRIVRVAASRARHQLVVLNPYFPDCPLLKGHKLA
ncbi:UvrD-helicase domain-containing protein [Lacisediminimonas profundi]|uniref:UvrD-helicase domain-containing protein n=1 Tax=Lacisediminimonas profundi TaxID=2603856 RepID=UPI00124B020A|nr:UvrD-helicase domain-containing protein [Lacisediminimonas profundi]